MGWDLKKMKESETKRKIMRATNRLTKKMNWDWEEPEIDRKLMKSREREGGTEKGRVSWER